jgi:hypothetical protein
MPKINLSPRNSVYSACFLAALVGSATIAAANENVVGRPEAGDQGAVDTNAEGDRGRQITLEQLPARVRAILGLSELESVGTGNHPFTTQGAGAEGSIEAVGRYPWSAAGKLFMKFGSSSFVCTASVVAKSLLVTAAHCVHNFGTGEDGFADGVSFEPARHGNEMPFGTWTAKEWWIPKAYFDGTDDCSPEAPGIVCANDLAIIVVDQKDGKSISDVVGKFNLAPADLDHEFGYVPFFGQAATQLTQLGYPSQSFDGVRMIRTDSLGYQADPNNVIIGSNQTAGSSGGGWYGNFGSTTSYTGERPTDDQINTVTSVTSWGYTSESVKVQGGSRFAKNKIYTEKTNIHSLVDDACAANPDAC